MEVNWQLFVGIFILALALSIFLYSLVFIGGRRKILSPNQPPKGRLPNCPICGGPASVIIKKGGVVAECTNHGCSHIWLRQGFLKVFCQCPNCLTPQPPLAA